MINNALKRFGLVNRWQKNIYSSQKKRSLDLTDWRIILIFYLSLQIITYILLYYMLASDPVNTVIWQLTGPNGNYAVIFYVKNLMIMSRFPIYFLISLGLPFVLFFYTFSKNNGSSTIAFFHGLKKFILAEAIAITLLLFNFSGDYTETSSLNPPLPPHEVIRGEIYWDLNNQILPTLAGFIVFFAILSVFFILSVDRSLTSMKKANTDLMLLQASEQAEELAKQYIQIRIPYITKAICESPSHNMEVLFETVLKEDIEHFRHLCTRNKIQVTSITALTDYCYEVATPLRMSFKMNLENILNDVIDPTVFMDTLDHHSNQHYKEVTKYCPHCGAQNRLGSSFCITCGEATI